MKIIAIASLKGGVGKTTLAAGLAAALSKISRVTVIDFDGQASLTDYFLRETPVDKILSANSYHVLSERKEPGECLHPIGLNLSIIPASLQIHLLTAEMAADPGAAFRVRSELQALDTDYLLIDCPPSMSYELRAALIAADAVLTPVTPDRWTGQGFDLLTTEIAKAEKSTGRKIPVYACPSIVTPREAETMQAAELFPNITAAIHKAAAVRSAMNKAARLKENSKSAVEFDALAAEIQGAA